MGMSVIKSGTITREESVGDIVESIAIEKIAIAHISHAESKKQSSICPMPLLWLLAFNHFVNKAVDMVIRMENAPKAKFCLFSVAICQSA